MRAFLKTQPKTQEDIKCSKDCMIRSVAIATDTPYSKVHEIMYKYGWRATRSKSTGKWEDQVTNTLDELGFKYRKVSYPAVKGESRMTATTMVNSGTFILRMSRHVAAYKEGILMDTWDCSDKCVYFAWEISK
jgi:hypothetical protein